MLDEFVQLSIWNCYNLPVMLAESFSAWALQVLLRIGSLFRTPDITFFETQYNGPDML